ncbi:SCO0607 family lipoprotein [Embleya sp. NPDC050493]|uniref:SCO0607 family lipoprotein n=1 Tax=Embleya sp. NPDC050493 TaxID=3363989 RepID=UPI0037AC3442
MCTPRRVPSAVVASRGFRGVVVPLVGMTAVACLLTAGCSTRERVCGSGEYPVKAVGSSTGRACVPDGRPPDPGWVRYPEGKVPRYLDDKWDRHWSTVVFDADGNVVAS